MFNDSAQNKNLAQILKELMRFIHKLVRIQNKIFILQNKIEELNIYENFNKVDYCNILAMVNKIRKSKYADINNLWEIPRNQRNEDCKHNDKSE